jgi:predicted AlkP superfamily phosphohydrolase/phosphomutase
MIVIGLDGATWRIIKPNLDSLPAFARLLEKYQHSVLECDVRPVHSAPSWATIFSGLLPEEHGIRHFVVKEEERRALAERKIFVWDRVKRAIVMGIPISLPPINRNYELRAWESIVLSVKEEEMLEGTRKLLNDTISAIQYGEADLLAVVFSEPDRAQHIFWHEPESVLRHYQSIDRALEKLMPHLEGRDFLILSDHGFTEAEETRRNNWDTVRENQTGGHHPQGMAISNRAPPVKVSEVCRFIESALKNVR